MKSLIVVLIILIAPISSYAEEFVTINDMSQVDWQMTPEGKVYFRNFNEFNSQALPCCYNYYIDTTTATGKSVWSVVLTKMATSSKLILGVPTLSQPGAVTYLGIW